MISEREEINQALYKLLFAIDEKDISRFESMLSGKDSIFDLDGWKIQGAFKISQLLKGHLKPLNTTHLALNTIIDFNDSIAIVSLYGLNQHYHAGTGLDDEKPKFLAMSRNQIHFVKVNGSWKAKIWTLNLKWSQGDRSAVMQRR